MRELPWKFKVFLISLYVFTISSIALILYYRITPIYIPALVDILCFAVLQALTESFMIQYKNLALTTSFVVHLAAFILFKPIGAVIIFIIGFTFAVIKVEGKYVHILNTPLYKTFYNYCVIGISILFSGIVCTVLGGEFVVSNPWTNFHIIIAFAIIYFLINTFITSVLYSILYNQNILYFIKNNTKLGLLSDIAMAPFGVVLAYMYSNFGIGGLLLVLLPIVIARYTISLYVQTKTQYVQMVDTLMRAMEARDKYTEGHSQRVAEIAKSIAEELKYNDSHIERLNIASLLHDVGKIGIDDSILNKPGKLTFEEYETIKSHPEIGYNILKEIKNLEDILPIIRHHHERYDGKGYPEGKKFEELSLDVFVVQLADTIDAMATDRPYRKALSEDKIIDEIVTYSGTQFHPKVVEAYLKIVERQKKAV
jgi:putative nucleotidyltransferase with HDIG domain